MINTIKSETGFGYQRAIEIMRFFKLAWFLQVICCLMLFSSVSCKKDLSVEAAGIDSWCEVGMAAGSTATGLGPQDLNVGYVGFAAPVKQGESLVFKGYFPHCRYASVVIYDQDFMPIDSIRDFEIVPLSGVNPFVPGTERCRERLGEFEIRVLMENPPDSGRLENTLYAGVAHDGRPNSTMILGYRIYLQDKGYGYPDNHPLAVYGGVEPPVFRMYDKNGTPYCPNARISRLRVMRTMAGVLWRNREAVFDPSAQVGELRDPPVWFNAASRDSQGSLSWVPNVDTSYIMLPVSKKFGDLLVLRWRAAKTPEETHTGKPFPHEADMRYWSLSFALMDASRRDMAYTEKTVADFQVPQLKDGTRQIVAGFGGIERPEAVPPEQWVGLNMETGFIIMRNILVDPDYPGLFWNLPAGDIPPEYDRFTPGGVYCSVKEFEANPDIGLERPNLIQKISAEYQD